MIVDWRMMMNCKKCGVVLKSNKEIENEHCEACFLKDYHAYVAKTHNAKVEQVRENKHLSAHQKRLIHLLRDNPDWVLKCHNPFNENAVYYSIRKPYTKTYDGGYTERWFEVVKKMEPSTGYVIEKHLYIRSLYESDEANGGTYQYYPPDENDNLY